MEVDLHLLVVNVELDRQKNAHGKKITKNPENEAEGGKN